jgi:DNA/RNA endonuclease G (NUC1)
MAITANVDLGNGVTASSCYIIVPTAYVKKFDELDKDGNPIGFKLIYDVEIYQNKSARDSDARQSKQIACREVDHHKITYDPTTSDNPFKLAYADLKTNSSLSSVSDA